MFKVPGTSSASADAEVHNEAAVAGSDTNLPAEDTARAPAYQLPEQGPLDAQGNVLDSCTRAVAACSLQEKESVGGSLWPRSCLHSL